MLQEEGLLLEPKRGLVSDLQMNCPGRRVLTQQGAWEGAPEWRAAGQGTREDCSAMAPSLGSHGNRLSF